MIRQMMCAAIISAALITSAGCSLITAQEETSPYTESLRYEQSENGYAVVGVGDEENIVIPPVYEGMPVIAIGEEAFARKHFLSVKIPDSVTEIGDGAFRACRELRTVNFGFGENGKSSGLRSIGADAFAGDTALESFTLPALCTQIGSGAFNRCGGLGSFSVIEGNEVYYSAGNCLIERASMTLIRGTASSVIPRDVVCIGTAAFRGCVGLSVLVIPDSIREISSYAFQDSEILSLEYEGDEEMWEQVTKASLWDMGTADDFTVHFSDKQREAL